MQSTLGKIFQYIKFSVEDLSRCDHSMEVAVKKGSTIISYCTTVQAYNTYPIIPF